MGVKYGTVVANSPIVSHSLTTKTDFGINKGNHIYSSVNLKLR